jgi:hypothetical protein
MHGPLVGTVRSSVRKVCEWEPEYNAPFVGILYNLLLSFGKCVLAAPVTNRDNGAFCLRDSNEFITMFPFQTRGAM